MMNTTLNKKIVLVFIALLLIPSAYAELAKINPMKSIILNEYNPETIIFNPPDIYVGIFEAGKEKYIVRTLLYFDINEIEVKNKHISNAYLEINTKKSLDFDIDTELDISVHKVLERWATATWNVQPRFDNNIIGKTILSNDGNYIIDIKDIVKEQALNPTLNYGILIKGTDEDKTKSPNLKQIEGINLIVEYENINDCNRNNGVCRKECGHNERETTISCGFFSGNRCCLESRKIITTTTIPTTAPSTTMPHLKTGISLENIQAEKCNDGTLDGFCSAKTSNTNKILSCKEGFLVEDNSCEFICELLRVSLCAQLGASVAYQPA